MRVAVFAPRSRCDVTCSYLFSSSKRILLNKQTSTGANNLIVNFLCRSRPIILKNSFVTYFKVLRISMRLRQRVNMSKKEVTADTTESNRLTNVGRFVDSSQAEDRKMIRLVKERRLLYARNNMPVASYHTQVKRLWEEVANEMGWIGITIDITILF